MSTSRLPTVLFASALAGAAAYAACSKSTPDEPVRSSDVAEAAPKAPPLPIASQAPAAENEKEIAWEAPKAWQSVPNTNSMRKATYKIPRAAGDNEDAELTVTAAAGGVEANIKRWAGQFGEAQPKVEERTPNGLKVSVVELRGTFAGGMGMGGASGSKEKFMLLGAVVDGGEHQTFFKMTGPEKTVSAAKKDFDAFVATFRAK